MLLYLSGPMRGYPRFNHDAFVECAAQLRAAGYEVISPVEVDIADGIDFTSDETIAATVQRDISGQPDEEYYLTRDENAIASCDGIALMCGYERSRGCAREIAAARALNLPIYPVLEWCEHSTTLQNYYGTQTQPLDEEPEQIMVDPNTGGAKANKLARFDLIPTDALWALAEHYGKCGGDGSDNGAKYDERNWERGYKWSLSYAALMRHINKFWSGKDIDPSCQSLHIIAAAWHCMSLAAFAMRGIGTDDRPKLRQ